MKNLFLMLVIILFTISSYGQTLETYGRYTSNGSVESDINFFGVRKLTSKINLTFFSLVEKKWSESLIGVAYSPSKYLELGLSTGIEQSSALYRMGGSIWMGKGNRSLLILLEKGDGRDNYWYKINLSEKISDELTVSIMAWRYHGVGPLFKYTPKKCPVSIWVMPAFEHETNVTKIMLGFDIPLK